MKKCANHYAVAVDLGASGGKMAGGFLFGRREAQRLPLMAAVLSWRTTSRFPTSRCKFLTPYIGMCLPFTAASSPV